jgi:hypothetical protein
MSGSLQQAAPETGAGKLFLIHPSCMFKTFLEGRCKPNRNVGQYIPREKSSGDAITGFVGYGRTLIFFQASPRKLISVGGLSDKNYHKYGNPLPGDSETSVDCRYQDRISK